MLRKHPPHAAYSDQDQSSIYLSHMAQTIDEAMITSSFELAGYKITKNLGITRGLIVRSRSAPARSSSVTLYHRHPRTSTCSRTP